MAFGSNRPTFKPSPYGYKRRRRGIPRWLVLLITGIVIGAGGVVFLQRSYGPQRLTAEQSTQLRMDLNSANLENQRLLTETKKQQEQLDRNEKEIINLNDQIKRLKDNTQEIQQGISSLIQAIPPDPRGTSPGIRSADMVLNDDGLHFQALIIQDPPKDGSPVQNLTATIKFIAIGKYRNGNTGYIEVGNQQLDMGLYKVIKGQASLPAGFNANQVAIQILAADTQKVIATRTIRISK